MNDKKFTQKNKKKSFIQENGFLIGLYSIVGVLVIAALGVTFYGTGTKPADNGLVAIESKAVGNSMDQSYTSNNDFSQIGTATAETPREIPKNTVDPTNSKTSMDTSTNGDTSMTEPTSNDVTQTEIEPITEEKAPTPDVKIKDNTNNSQTTVSEQVEININSDIVSSNQLFEDDVTTVISEPSLALTIEEKSNDSYEFARDNINNNTVTTNPVNDPYFADESIMKWPINGDILMNYSMDKMVYDKTLDQFRTNDSVYIRGKIGDTVVAAADGVVLSTGKSIENGTYIIINHGNGWKTIYSQLDEAIKVSQGETVKEGQLLGHIGNPSNYSVEQGSHLNFKVMKNEVAVNPLTMLAE